MISPVGPTQDRGFILLVVIWMVALFALTTTAFVKAVQAHLRATTVQIQSSRAELVADSGLALVVLDLIESQVPGRQRKFAVKGALVTCTLDEDRLTIRLQDAAGRLNLNLASDRLLQALFIGLGASRQVAGVYSGAIIDFRAPAAAPLRASIDKPDYQAAGRRLGPKNAPLDSLEELRQIAGLDGAMIKAMRPHVTIHSGIAGLDPEVTSPALTELLARGYESLAAQAQSQLGGSGWPGEFVVASTKRTYMAEIQGEPATGALYVREVVIELVPNQNSLPIYKVWRRSLGGSLPREFGDAPPPCLAS